MIAARAYGLRSFLVVYKQEALIPASPMNVDMIFPHSWDSIYKDASLYGRVGRNVCGPEAKGG